MKNATEMTVPELKARAKELELKGFSRLKKNELLVLVLGAEQALLEAGKVRNSEPTEETEGSRALDSLVQTIEPLNLPCKPTRKNRNKAKARRRKLRSMGFPAGF